MVNFALNRNTFTALLFDKVVLGLPSMCTILEHENSSIIIDGVPVD